MSRANSNNNFSEKQYLSRDLKNKEWAILKEQMKSVSGQGNSICKDLKQGRL